MKPMRKIMAVVTALMLLLALFVSPAYAAGKSNGILAIREQGAFSSGGTVTQPVNGTYDATKSFTDPTRAGNTAHVDHANVFYQIPAIESGHPIVYLHGYGQSRLGWMTTPDGREGWSDIFLTGIR